ncbi:MAG: CatB-related O-acetyltransferase [Gomphosphaeria aponina SAG 52.96 = DSM 107014]|uniref:CatB-related O-acetyltransferase n=1 Tax=Gomphosphaeria aponina SAG 52.96 = DSM 107014 TaxID=1521640 RepID=A0A941JUJ6_9CHRO|nr:CatB-related O-acetyltransferase [Gomphosphaeria aponina SAG 52.96 = DSM 107014]
MMESELKASLLSPLLIKAYRYPLMQKQPMQQLLKVIFLLTEGGCYRSATLRKILKTYNNVELGAYSYGFIPDLMNPFIFPAGVTIGRYVSIAQNVCVFLQNHPIERLSTHPYFYAPSLGYVQENTLPPSTSLEIGHDAWIGHGALITPGCNRIGIGAVVGAGAIVTKDVPDFAIVAGNPAKLIRKRFSDEVGEIILKSKWWEKSIDELKPYIKDMLLAVNEQPFQHSLLLSQA